MSVYVFLAGRVVNACQQFVSKTMDARSACKVFKDCSTQIASLENRRLKDLLESVASTFDIFWYAMAMDVEETQNGYEEIRKEMLPYVEKIEKLVIKGREDESTITDNERAEWWKYQKEREREEFYKMNGYYEDE